MSDGDEHQIAAMGRVQLGRGTVRGAGMRYGTVVRCSCGWRRQVNTAPSRGGDAHARELWEEHELECRVHADLFELRGDWRGDDVRATP